MSCEHATCRGPACECLTNQGGTTEIISVLILMIGTVFLCAAPCRRSIYRPMLHMDDCAPPYMYMKEKQREESKNRRKRNTMGIYEELRARGLIAQVTDEEEIRK